MRLRAGLLTAGILLGTIVQVLLGDVASVAATQEEELQKQAEEARRAMEVFLRRQKVFVREGEVFLDFTTLYIRDTQSQVNPGTTPGTQFSSKLNFRSVDTSLILRYGLLDALEMNVTVPFVYAQRDTDLGATTVTLEDKGIGDMRAGFKYQILYEEDSVTDLIVDVFGQAPTGTGPLLGTEQWNVGGGLTFLKTIDPVVFFGRLGYAELLGRDGRSPRYQVSYLAGLGFSLNDRVSLNMQVNGAVVERGLFNGQALNSQDIINLQFSTTVRVTRQLYIEPLVQFGISDDAPDVVTGLTFPYQF